MHSMSMSAKIKFIQQSTNLSSSQIGNCVELLEQDCTIPFIARYRKDITRGLNEIEIEDISNALAIWKKIEDRKASIFKSLKEQGKLSSELSDKLEAANTLTALEDIYLPFKKKTKTKATLALESGLKPLAVAIMKESTTDPVQFATKLTSTNYPSAENAIEGAIDICADWINNNEWIRNRLRKIFASKSVVASKLVKGKQEDGEKFNDFFDFSEPYNRIKPHRFMAINRGKNLGLLRVSIAPPQKDSVDSMEYSLVKQNNLFSELLKKAIKQAYSKQLKQALERELLNQLIEKSENEAVAIFRKNLEQILMTAPLRNKKVLAIDPGFKSGCKIVCLSETGELKHNETIYPHAPQHDSGAMSKINTLVQSYKIDAIAIGNGTASRETERLIKQIRFNREIQVFVVSEAGASVYSASRVARQEFPNYDVTVRGAVSIGRRLQDPLSELVKIDPKALGVGQYQHDITPSKLELGLTRTIEFCVNKVGVDINSCSSNLLNYVSGVGTKLAESIVEYRQVKGVFETKKDLMNAKGLGAKAFEQCAGFIRINNAKNPLDNSAIHPESYEIANRVSKQLSIPLEDLIGNKEALKNINASDFIDAETGMQTVQFILDELAKPNRDPRKIAKVFEFKKDLKTINDLSENDVVPGIVSNITGFGAFVDIGIKENGLLHLSEMADRYVSDPNEVVSMNQTLELRVKSIDRERKRIALSLKGIS